MASPQIKEQNTALQNPHPTYRQDSLPLGANLLFTPSTRGVSALQLTGTGS